jgi:hypothetical protein
MQDLRKVFGAGSTAPSPFGRTKSDRARVEAIERDRRVPAPDLMSRLEPQLADLRVLLAGMSPDDWSVKVSHSTRGIMGMDQVMEEFLVGHLEAHADQLEGLLEGAS